MKYSEDDYFKAPSYKKKKKKQVPKKSDHKHIYSKEVLFEYCIGGHINYHYATMCSICGKVGKENFFETERVEGTNFSRALSSEEILEKYKGLPVLKRSGV